MEIGKLLPKNYQSAWSHIIILDRPIDLVTPFLTPFTYEAVAAEYIGIQYGITRVGGNSEGVIFGAEDPISSSIRLLSMQEATKSIQDLYATIKKEFDELKAVNNDVTKMKEVAEKTVINNQSITMHFQILENCTKNGANKEPSFRKVKYFRRPIRYYKFRF